MVSSRPRTAVRFITRFQRVSSSKCRFKRCSCAADKSRIPRIRAASRSSNTTRAQVNVKNGYGRWSYTGNACSLTEGRGRHALQLLPNLARKTGNSGKSEVLGKPAPLGGLQAFDLPLLLG